ncbi:GNAT family N-acetyltransferase [Massilia sp. Mn16-1_5]|uniref:GNAT family N-acetyltransferase n=1 Tax=Massilia sp. Mn16-1_5 TaxID=2079199 RepID=UPI00109EE102|nr:GNAT family N-acetyltransferase [Massilia sp. Mn16-1_5]THC44851.1 GNAT family N-acetyltransferase [Massilia sp. Mn16-1_5]
MIHSPSTAAHAVRRLGPADAAQYRALRLAGLRAFPHAFRPAVEEALEQPLSWAEKRLATKGEYWFGAFDGIELVGAICLRTQDGVKIRHSASLNALVVDPERQREGIGAALVAHLIDFARSLDYIRQITLTVIDGNAAAIGLYERFGFRQFGLEPDAVLHDGAYYAKQHRQLSLVTS